MSQVIRRAWGKVQTQKHTFCPKFRHRGLWDDRGAVLERQFGQLCPTGLRSEGLRGSRAPLVSLKCRALGLPEPWCSARADLARCFGRRARKLQHWVGHSQRRGLQSRSHPCATTQWGRTLGPTGQVRGSGLSLLMWVWVYSRSREEVRDCCCGPFGEPHPWGVVYVAPSSSLSPR